jgi:hypothetical protein
LIDTYCLDIAYYRSSLFLRERVEERRMKKMKIDLIGMPPLIRGQSVLIQKFFSRTSRSQFAVLS